MDESRIKELELQFSILNNFDLMQLNELQNNLLAEQSELNGYLQQAEVQLPELQKANMEMQLIQKLNTVVGQESTNIDSVEISKKYERYLFEFEAKKSRLSTIQDVLNAIQKFLPLKMLNSNVESVVSVFQDINTYYEANKKKLVKGDYGLLNGILQRLFTELQNIDSLNYQIEKNSDKFRDANQSHNLITLLNYRLKMGNIHLNFLNDTKLFDIQDLFNGNFYNYLIESLDKLFQDGQSYIENDGGNNAE